MTTALHADRLSRNVAACASHAPGYDGYEDRSQRRRREESVRRAAAASVRQTAVSLSDRQRDLTGPDELGRATQLERQITRARRTIDELEAAPRRFGSWFEDKKLSADARLALAVADRQLLEAARELADTARSGPGASGEGDWMVLLRESLDAVRAEAADRGVALADDHSPAAPTHIADGDAYPGESVWLEGVAHDVVRRSRWPAGDIALDLAGDGGGLVLWTRPNGELVAFEPQTLELPDGPADRISAADQEFELARHDVGILLERDAFGRHRREAERWLYLGRGGAWLWVESGGGGGWATMRGVSVDHEDFAAG